MITADVPGRGSDDYRRVEQAIAFIEGSFLDQPGLEEIAASVHLSKYHFHRLFKRWAGVTPLQFMHYLTVEYAKEKLKGSGSVFDTTLDAGLSGPGRLHDLFVTFEAVTPGEFKKMGAGLEIRYGYHPTPFGDCLIAATRRGICALRFNTDESRDAVLSGLKDEWPRAGFVDDPAATQQVADRLFSAVQADERRGFRLLLKGTNFQVRVWQALLRIPRGSVVTYQDVACFVSGPTASRAVAGAVAANPIGYLIPCHRVISKSGRAHHYRWGSSRKKAILGWEASLS